MFFSRFKCVLKSHITKRFPTAICQIFLEANSLLSIQTVQSTLGYDIIPDYYPTPQKRNVTWRVAASSSEMGRARPSKKLMVELPLSSGIIKYGQISFCVKKQMLLPFQVPTYPDTKLYFVIRETDKLPEIRTVLVTCWTFSCFTVSPLLKQNESEWWYRIASIKFMKDLRKRS